MIGHAIVCGITVIAESIAESTVTTEPIAVMATYCSNNSSYVSVSIRCMSLLHTVIYILIK